MTEAAPQVTRDAEIRQMSNLLRDGAALLSQACPRCATPLFRLKSGEIMCPSCNQRVIIPALGEDASRLIAASVVSSLEETIAQKLEELRLAVALEQDREKLFELSRQVTSWLVALEKIRTLKAK